jgi:hypothetical protein
VAKGARLPSPPIPSYWQGACGAFVLSAAVLAWRLVAIANADDGKMTPVVKTEATSTKPDSEGRQTVTIQLDVKEGHRILANPVQCDDLVPAQTTVIIASADKLQDVKIECPPGKRMTLLGDMVFYIYEGKIEIKAFVKGMAGDTAPLDITVTCFPRNDRRTFLPETIKLQIK